MTDKIIRLLGSLNIEHYLINEIKTEGTELYFVRRRLDMKRAKSTHKCNVSVYRDEDKDGCAMRGVAEVLIFSDMSDEEISAKLESAYSSAEYSLAPAYPLCEGYGSKRTGDSTFENDLDSMAQKYAEAVFLHDTGAGSYVNCAEIYVTREAHRIVNSRGVDVEYTEYRCDGELVVTSKEGEDVELFDYFSYTGDGSKALSERVRELLLAVFDRAKATRTLNSGEYDLIIEGDACRELYGYYLWKANAKNIHTGYSNAKKGELISSPDGVASDIECMANTPYDKEGIESKNRTLIKDGELVSYIGDMRFCSYIGAEPTGDYERICVKEGKRALSEMKKTPYLHVVSFSDFQFDPLDGYFGGEIRLAYLYDGQELRSVTGGSVSSNITKLRDSAEASLDIYESYTYKGPRAIKIKGVCVSGTNDKK